MRKAYVDTPAGQIHYRLKPGSGTPIICFHQTASSSAMFEKFASAYRGPEPIYALDTPGFGGSFDPEGMPDMAGYGAMLLDAIGALNLTKVHLFGHHTGASIAVEIAARDPGRVASLMMIGPVVLTAEERKAFGAYYPKPFAPQADGTHLQVMWDYIASIGGNADLALHHREMVDTARAWEGHIKVYSKIWDQDFTAIYRTIKTPMLIMCAQKDVLWPMFERARQLRPDAVAVEIPGSNFQPDEAPAEVAAAVARFLKAL
jgi:pimeloyl-ACP methyl ester carboxylesterase